MNIENKIEQAIFDRSGGGKKGEKAVIAYRDYIDCNTSFLRQARKDFARQRYLPKNENQKGTSRLYTKIDE